MEKEDEVRGIIGLLNSITEMVENAALTGAFKNGSKPMIKSYNTVLGLLRELDLVSEKLFSDLAENASLDEVGIASSQLEAFINGVIHHKGSSEFEALKIIMGKEGKGKKTHSDK
jgi:hypothetical protein